MWGRACVCLCGGRQVVVGEAPSSSRVATCACPRLLPPPPLLNPPLKRAVAAMRVWRGSLPKKRTRTMKPCSAARARAAHLNGECVGLADEALGVRADALADLPAACGVVCDRSECCRLQFESGSSSISPHTKNAPSRQQRLCLVDLCQWCARVGGGGKDTF